MRKFVCCLLSVVCCVTACRKTSTTSAPGAKDVRVHANVIPADGSDANVKTTLPLDITVLERSALGTEIDKAGNVVNSKDVFRPGEPVYLSMWLKMSPVGLQTSARFTDAKDHDVAWPKMNMHGEKVVTFKLDTKNLPPGEYHAIGYWGMDEERNYKFTIEGHGKKK